MTAPITQQQPPPPPEQPPGEPVTDAEIVAGLAVLLASAATVPPIAAIGALLMRARNPKVSRPAAIAAAQVVLKWGQPTTEPLGAAGKRMQRINVQRRAQYLFAAARRINRQLGSDRSKEAVAAALQKERQYWRQHVDASAKREQAATTVDSAAARDGKTVADKRGRHRVLLSWRSVNDERTTAECRAANGKLFYADQPPRIGYPGTTHVHCRCRPAPPGNAREFVDGGTLTR